MDASISPEAESPQAYLETEDIEHAIQNLANYLSSNVLQESLHSSSDDASEGPLLEAAPNLLSFYDRHLDSTQQLLHVVPSSSIVGRIASVFDLSWQEAQLSGEPLPAAHENAHFPYPDEEMCSSPGKDARCVLRRYLHGPGTFGPRIASTLLLRPRSKLWETFFCLDKDQPQDSLTSDILWEDWAPTINGEKLDTLSSTENCLPPETQHLLQEAAKRFSPALVFQFFSQTAEAEEVLRNLCSAPILSPFPWVGCRAGDTSSSIPSSSHVKPGIDADDVVGQIIPPQGQSNKIQVRRSARLESKARNKAITEDKARPPKRRRTGKHQPTVSFGDTMLAPPRIVDSQLNDSTATAISVLQHAWHRAVQADATFILFRAGRLERIGIRHRASNTLYLTELMDTAAPQIPYGALQIGLYICVLKDLLSRVPKYVKNDQSRSTQTRLLNESRWPPSTSRRRTRALTSQEIIEQNGLRDALAHGVSRHLLLLRFQYQTLNTPHASAFFRVQTASKPKERYSAEEWIRLTALNYIARGATGDVYEGKLDVPVTKESALQCNIVLKLAIYPLQRKRLRHEFSMYKHLNGSGVTGIPAIFGLFQDSETRALALVMEDLGECALNRQIDPDNGSKFYFSDQEKAQFLSILGKIHDAGVRHRDIRPENLLLNGQGRASIIDFDRALIGASQSSREKERQHLIRLLHGDYWAPYEQSSLTEHDADYESYSGPSSEEEYSLE